MTPDQAVENCLDRLDRADGAPIRDAIRFLADASLFLAQVPEDDARRDVLSRSRSALINRTAHKAEDLLRFCWDMCDRLKDSPRDSDIEDLYETLRSKLWEDRPPIDYRELLTKYLAYRGNNGGVLHLDDADLAFMREFPERYPVTFTDEEWAELQSIARNGSGR